MRLSTRIGAFVLAMVMVALLAACAGGTEPDTPKPVDENAAISWQSKEFELLVRMLLKIPDETSVKPSDLDGIEHIRILDLGGIGIEFGWENMEIDQDFDINEANTISYIFDWSNPSTLTDLLPGNDLRYFKHLKTLMIQGCNIPNSALLERLTELRGLCLINCQVNTASFMENMKELQIAILTRNNISNISAIHDLPKLAVLNLNSNKIAEVSGLSGLPALRTLVLTDNQIADPSPIPTLPALEMLYLDYNRITSIYGLKDQPTVWWLNIASNQLSDISPLNAFSGPLTRLHINDNQIVDISPVAHFSATLNELYIAENPIADFSPLGSLLPDCAVIGD